MKTIIYTLLIFTLYSAESKEHRILSTAEELKRARVQQIYTAELGVKESSGRNDGPRVEEYLRQVGLKKGDPWCAAFVCWVFDQAGVANPRTGWSPGLFPKERVVWERGKGAVSGKEVAVAGKGVAVAGKEVVVAGKGVAVVAKEVAGRVVAVAGERVAGGVVAGAGRSLPQRGDVFGIWFPDKGRIAHVGFVDRWDESWLITVEGNTNEAGSREGDGVWRKRRLVRSLWQVSRFIN